MPINFGQISDTLSNVTNTFETTTSPPTSINELSDKEMRRITALRVVLTLIIIGSVSVLIFTLIKEK